MSARDIDNTRWLHCDNNTRVCDNNHDLTLNYGTDEPLLIWWKDGPEKIEFALFFTFKVLE